MGKSKILFGVKPKVVTETSKELQQLCICECEPCFSEESFWEEGYEKVSLWEKDIDSTGNLSMSVWRRYTYYR